MGPKKARCGQANGVKSMKVADFQTLSFFPYFVDKKPVSSKAFPDNPEL